MPRLGAGPGRCGPAAKERRKPFAMAGRCWWRVLGRLFLAQRTRCCGERLGQGFVPMSCRTREARAAPRGGLYGGKAGCVVPTRGLCQRRTLNQDLLLPPSTGSSSSTAEPAISPGRGATNVPQRGFWGHSARGSGPGHRRSHPTDPTPLSLACPPPGSWGQTPPSPPPSPAGGRAADGAGGPNLPILLPQGSTDASGARPCGRARGGSRLPASSGAGRPHCSPPAPAPPFPRPPALPPAPLRFLPAAAAIGCPRRRPRPAPRRVLTLGWAGPGDGRSPPAPPQPREAAGLRAPLEVGPRPSLGLLFFFFKTLGFWFFFKKKKILTSLRFWRYFPRPGPRHPPLGG